MAGHRHSDDGIANPHFVRGGGGDRQFSVSYYMLNYL